MAHSESAVTLKLASVVQRAAYLRESSYNWSGQLADLERTLIARTEAVAAASDDMSAGIFIDFGRADGYYTRTLEQSVEQACVDLDADPALARVLYLALDAWWNDTLDWARGVTGVPDTPIPEREQWNKDMDAVYDRYPKSNPARG